MKTNLEMLREAQAITGLNQRNFGTYIGVSKRTISNWMTGTRRTPAYVAEMALRLAKYDAKAAAEGERASDMFRWAVIAENSHGDEQMMCYGSKADALREAAEYWSHLTEKEQETANRFEVSLIHVQFTPEYDCVFNYYEGENGICDSDTYECAKSYIK